MNRGSEYVQQRGGALEYHQCQFYLHRVLHPPQPDRGGCRIQQSVSAAAVGETAMEFAVLADGGGGHRGQCDRHVDRVEPQANANRYQYIFSEFSHRRYDGLHLKRYLQFRVHVEWRLGLWQIVL